jgi:hypothetical protein
MAWPLFDANAVYCTSATSASEIQAPSWSSQIAHGYRIGVQASSPMEAIAGTDARVHGTVTENRVSAPPLLPARFVHAPDLHRSSPPENRPHSALGYRIPPEVDDESLNRHFAA